MTTSIFLENDWHCEYFELEPSLYEFMNGLPVASLSQWTFDKRRVEGWAAWLQHKFTLEPTDDCVSYFLYIDSAPPQTRIYFNGQYVGDYVKPHDDEPLFEIDVTPYVFLEENSIAFRIGYHEPAAFRNVRLQPVPCD